MFLFSQAVPHRINERIFNFSSSSREKTAERSSGELWGEGRDRKRPAENPRAGRGGPDEAISLGRLRCIESQSLMCPSIHSLTESIHFELTFDVFRLLKFRRRRGAQVLLGPFPPADGFKLQTNPSCSISPFFSHLTSDSLWSKICVGAAGIRMPQAPPAAAAA